MLIEFTDNFEHIKINGIEYEPKHKRPPSGKYPSDICDKCGNEAFSTYDSRVINGYRIRRKSCLYCGNRWKTVEYKFKEKGRPKIDRTDDIDDDM